MPDTTVHQIIRDAEKNFLTGTTKMGQYVDWSMHDTIERIDAYLNSKHLSGEKDSLGRDKPFFDIVTAAVNIWYRATDIDRKDIKFRTNSTTNYVLALVANVMLQNWMDENRFGVFLNQWGRGLARYGSVVSKFIEQDGQLKASVIPWNRFIADPVQFDALPRIEKFYLTPAQLRRRQEYNQDVVDALIEARHRATRKTLDGTQKDTMSEFIELYEVHGEMPVSIYKLAQNPDAKINDSDENTYKQQMHVVSYSQERGKAGYDDFTLFCGYEAKDPYVITHLIEEEGRTLARGAVEYLFDAQWMANHTVKNMKDTLDLASRMIFQTADSHFVGRNVLSAIETGDILVHDVNKPLERIANDNPSIVALQNFGNMWQSMGQQLTNTPDLTRGVTQAQPLTYGLGQILNQNSNSLFEIMTESKGLSLEDMLLTHVIPHLKKQLNHSEEIVGILDSAGISEIDALYIPRAAVKRFNDRAVKQTFDNAQQFLRGGEVNPMQPFNAQQEAQGVQQDLGQTGNKRFFKPDEIGDATWKRIFSDFEWTNIKVEVTNENHDKQAVLQTLSTVLQTIATNPTILQDPNAKMIFASILNETGAISPLQISNASALPQPPQQGLSGLNPLQAQSVTPLTGVAQ